MKLGERVREHTSDPMRQDKCESKPMVVHKKKREEWVYGTDEGGYYMCAWQRMDG